MYLKLPRKNDRKLQLHIIQQVLEQLEHNGLNQDQEVVTLIKDATDSAIHYTALKLIMDKTP